MRRPNEPTHLDWIAFTSTTTGHVLASPPNTALDDTDMSVSRLL